MLEHGSGTALTEQRTMRAVLLDGFGDVGSLHLADSVAVPRRVMSEVLVRVLAAGVNPIDVATRTGAGAAAAGLSGWPAVLGCDFSGVVEESPYESAGFSPGDEVFGVTAFPRGGGSYAEFAVAPLTTIARKPRVLSHVEAAAVPTAATTAWGAVVELAKAHEGQRLLILGAGGGVGHFAVQLGAHFGAHVIASSTGPNEAWLRELGAAATIDYTTARFEEAIAPVDVVIDLAGDRAPAGCSRALSVLRPNGLLVSVGDADRPELQDEALRAGVRATTFRVAPQTPTLAVLARLIGSGDLKVHVDAVYPLEQVADAQRLVESGAARGKIVVRVSDY